MTHNQIEFWQLQRQQRADAETARSNKARETETNRSNRANEGINIAQLQEQSRHNRATEGETARSNRANEAIRSESNQISWSNLAETSKHNRMTENIAIGELQERQRSNQANEAIGFANAQTARYNAQQSAKHNFNQDKINKYQAEANVAYNNAQLQQNQKQRVNEFWNSVNDQARGWYSISPMKRASDSVFSIVENTVGGAARGISQSLLNSR